MSKVEEMQKLQGDSFYMEFLGEDARGMTDEEIYKALDTNLKLALRGVDDFNRKFLKEKLLKEGIDPSTVDIDKMLGIEEMPIDFEYYKLKNGMIVKVNTDEMQLYILDEKNKVWRESIDLFIEFERECIPKEKIEIEDNYKIGEPCQNGRYFR